MFIPGKHSGERFLKVNLNLATCCVLRGWVIWNLLPTLNYVWQSIFSCQIDKTRRPHHKATMVARPVLLVITDSVITTSAVYHDWNYICRLHYIGSLHRNEGTSILVTAVGRVRLRSTHYTACGGHVIEIVPAQATLHKVLVTDWSQLFSWHHRQIDAYDVGSHQWLSW